MSIKEDFELLYDCQFTQLKELKLGKNNDIQWFADTFKTSKDFVNFDKLAEDICSNPKIDTLSSADLLHISNDENFIFIELKNIEQDLSDYINQYIKLQADIKAGIASTGNELKQHIEAIRPLIYKHLDKHGLRKVYGTTFLLYYILKKLSLVNDLESYLSRFKSKAPRPILYFVIDTSFIKAKMESTTFVIHELTVGECLDSFNKMFKGHHFEVKFITSTSLKLTPLFLT